MAVPKKRKARGPLAHERAQEARGPQRCCVSVSGLELHGVASLGAEAHPRTLLPRPIGRADAGIFPLIPLWAFSRHGIREARWASHPDWRSLERDMHRD